MQMWEGVFPAVTTKMTEDGKIDPVAMKASIDRLVQNGVSGLVVLPMLGENASLSMHERETVIGMAKEVVGNRVPVLSGLAEITLENAKQNGACRTDPSFSSMSQSWISITESVSPSVRGSPVLGSVTSPATIQPWR